MSTAFVDAFVCLVAAFLLGASFELIKPADGSSRFLQHRRRIFSALPACMQPPDVDGGFLAQFMVTRGKDGSLASHVVYGCDNGDPIGNRAINCRWNSGDLYDGEWVPGPPTCPTSPNNDGQGGSNVGNAKVEHESSPPIALLNAELPAPDAQEAPPPSQPSPCTDYDTVDDVAECPSSQWSTQFRFDAGTNSCQEHTGCRATSSSQNTFDSLLDCAQVCLGGTINQPVDDESDNSNNEEPNEYDDPSSDQPEPEEPEPGEPHELAALDVMENEQPEAKNEEMDLNQLVGGYSGPHCLDGYGPPHSSCLEDSKLLVRTEAVDPLNILTGHNFYREDALKKASYMPMLKWNSDLQIMAERWAATCPTGHDDGDNRRTNKWEWVGQNICWSKNYRISWDECIKNWANERLKWAYGKGSIDGSVVGHYTQLVWANTTDVGCGIAHCTGEWDYVLVCDYGPGGNVATMGDDPFARPYLIQL